MRKFALLIVALLASVHLSAQTKLTGSVTDASNSEPLIGASVMVKGTSTGGVTDFDGNFSITVPQGKTEIVVSSIGYKSQTIKVNGKTSLKIQLQPDAQLMDEVVVVGYGTMKKSDLSGALGQLKGDDLMKGGALDLAHGMQGKVAGVQIQQNDGAPGGGISITVRGANSFYGDASPLYIVDGVPFDTGSTPSNGGTQNEQKSNPLSSINPHDIENIEILKDASATAIYGSRGANGVVLITTKKGKAGKPRVELTSNFGVSHITKKLDMLSAYEYAIYQNEAKQNDIDYRGVKTLGMPYSGEWGYKYYTDGYANYNTGQYTGSPEDYITPGWHYDEYGNSTLLDKADWQDEIFQTAWTQEYNLSVSGGSDRGWYSFSGNYTDQDGTIKNSGFTRYTLRANMAYHVTDWLEIGTNQSFANSSTDFANTLSYNTGVVRSALLFPPTYGPNMDTTQEDNINWLAANPAAYVNTAKDQLKSINYFSSSFFEAQLLPSLKFRQNLGLSYSNQNRGSYYGRRTQEGKTPRDGKASRGTSMWQSLTAESILTFDKTFDKIHKVNLMGAFTAESSQWESTQMTASGFPDDITQDNDMSRALNRDAMTSDKGDQKLASFLGRLNYTLKDRYILTASFRTDGSSKFTDKNKWATFLSGAFAWRASEEKFIKDLNVFSNLKFRVSYGETGNQGIGPYRTKEQLATANYPFNGTMNSGAAMWTWRGPVDENIKWETTSQINAGIDFGWWDNRLTLTVDYYYKKTRDLLQEVKIPSSTGFSNMLTNTGNVTNEGLEMTLNFTVIDKKDWHWDLSGNISFNRNKLGGLDADQYVNSLWYNADQVFIRRNGCPMGAIYGYVEDGFYDNEAETIACPGLGINGTNVVGEIKYVDFNHDGKITTDDRRIIGDTNPDFIYGLTNNISWKDLTLSFMFQGSQGNDIFNGNLMDVSVSNIGNITQDIYDHSWRPENYEQAEWPIALADGNTRSFLLSNRYVEDGSYLKLKNVSLGYNWNRPFKGLDAIKFSFTATNLFTISKYSWYDPDVNAFGGAADKKGVDIYSYPTSRTFTFGMNFVF